MLGSLALDIWPQAMFLYEDTIIIGGQNWNGGSSAVVG